MSGDLDTFDELLAANFVDHDPAPDQGPGVEGLKGFFRSLRTAFPDLKVTPVHAVPTEDHLAIAYTIEGTHTGPLMGISPSGKRVMVRGMQIARYENGKIAERWGSSDQLGILQQIGATTVPT